MNAGMLYSAKTDHRIKCGLQWGITQSRFDVYALRFLHEIISRGSTNYGDYLGPVTGDSGMAFADIPGNNGSFDLIGRLYVDYKGDRLYHSVNTYAEDEWTPTPRLTVNYGGRIEGSTSDDAVTFSPRTSVK